jgi:hypothetical protein
MAAFILPPFISRKLKTATNKAAHSARMVGEIGKGGFLVNIFTEIVAPINTRSKTILRKLINSNFLLAFLTSIKLNLYRF